MRLIDVSTKRLAAGYLGNVEYAILSHRWEEDYEEVTFQEMQNAELPRHKKGFRKIEKCCEQAQQDGLQYVWVDTCCIDKTSSAELQEAINSMYQWYEESKVCYAYLKDVEPGQEDIKTDEWFGRGWTFQELIAPREMKFFNKRWQLLGDKKGLSEEIHAATGIDQQLLMRKSMLEDYSIAQRMSWASNRTTKRIEDRAYSLFGIFQVNLPMLYGEGSKAFMRLQEEIIRHTDDHSIFAWRGLGDNTGLLAPSPEAFMASGAVVSVGAPQGRQPFSVTNRGISITLNMTPWTTGTYLALIFCRVQDSPLTRGYIYADGLMGIFLQRLDEDDQYARVAVQGIEILDNVNPYLRAKEKAARERENLRKNYLHPWSRDMSVYVRQIPSRPHRPLLLEGIYGFHINRTLLDHDIELELLNGDLYGSCFSDGVLSAVPGEVTDGTIGMLEFLQDGKRIAVVKLGFDPDFNPICMLEKAGAGSIQALLAKHPFGEKDIFDRSPYDNFPWDKVRRLTGRAAIKETHWRPGLWAVKGDRVYGIDVALSETSPTTRVILRRRKIEERVVWNLEIRHLSRIIETEPNAVAKASISPKYQAYVEDDDADESTAEEDLY